MISICAPFSRPKHSSLGLIACAILAGLVACSRDGSLDVGDQHPVRPLKANTRAIEQFLTLGMRSNVIVARLGPPTLTLRMSRDQEMWQYALDPAPVDDARQRVLAVGITCQFTNGCLASWGFIHAGGSEGETADRSEVQPGVRRPAGPTAIEVFLVNAERLDNGRYVDRESFPKLGWIAAVPELTIAVLKDFRCEEHRTTPREQPPATNWTFSVTLNEEDAKRLAAVTGENMSRQFLIVVGGEPVFAPVVRQSLDAGGFEIPCDERTLREFISTVLASMRAQR